MAIDPLHTGERKSVFARMRLDTRPFKHRDFRNMWLGQAVSTIGGEIGAVAVPYQVYTLTHSTALVGLLGLASLIPLLFVPLIGGAIADANDRRSVLLRTETGMALVAGAFVLNSQLAHPRVWVLFVLQSVAVAIFSLGRPAMSSLTPRLVPDEEIPAAVALSSVYSSLAGVGGPAVGGILIELVGFSWTYGIDLATYAASFFVIWLLPRLPPIEDVDRPSLKSIVDGFRFLKGRQPILGIFAVDTSAMVFGMPTRALPGRRVAPARRRCVDRRVPLRGAGRRCARRLALLGLDLARPPAGARRHGCGVRVGRVDRGLRLHDLALARALLPRGGRRRRLLQRRSAQHDPDAFDARRICSGGCRGSSSRRWRARRASATWRQACSRRSRRCGSRSSRAVSSA